VQDIFLLQSKLADIGITKGSAAGASSLPSYMPIYSSSSDMLSSSRHLSSALGESFMLLNQSIMKAGDHPRAHHAAGSSNRLSKAVHSQEIYASPVIKAANKISTPIEHKLTPSSTHTPIKSIQRQSNAQLPVSSKGNEAISSPAPSWAGMLGGILGFASPDIHDNEDDYHSQRRNYRSPADPRIVSNPAINGSNGNSNGLTHGAGWIDQSSFSIREAVNMNDSQMSMSNTGLTRNDSSSSIYLQATHNQQETSTQLLDDLVRLQRTIKTLRKLPP
jgi:hypothetical protein